MLELLTEHRAETDSGTAWALLATFDPGRFSKVTTRVAPERIEG